MVRRATPIRRPKGPTVDHHHVSRRRAIPLASIVLAALLVATVVSTAPSESARASEQVGHHDTATRTSRVAFHDHLRKLWEDHVTWTRLAIVTFADGSPGFDATAARLMRNQTAIGNAVKPYYGNAAGTALTALLKDHISIAVELLQAARAGDTAAFTDAKSRWYSNSNAIADFLTKANPRFWPRHMMRVDMRTHLNQTLAEASHELTGDYPASVRDYEAIHRHILDMADMLSAGIIQQFPRRFR
jgi:hypothetical protein